MAQKFRKKPVIIEAVQFTGENIDEVRRFCGTHRDPDTDIDRSTFNSPLVWNRWGDESIIAEVWDKLHETWVGVKLGQWIIKGVQAEFYPCDEKVFEDTYSRAGW